MSRTVKVSDPITIAKPHTIKKFELISSYVDEWARKILGYRKSRGIVYIDCMCNCGMYYNEQENLIEGTAIRVVKILNQIAINFPDKKIVLYFNDLDNSRVEKLEEFINSIDHDLDRHPIFPSDGFKREIKDELKAAYGASFPIKQNVAVFKNGVQ